MNFFSNCCRADRRLPETAPDFLFYAVFATSIVMASASRDHPGDAVSIQAPLEKGKRLDLGFLQDARS